MARPTKQDKKAPVALKLPPYLIEWMNRQPESRAVLIETALTGFYQIPIGVQVVTSTQKRVDDKPKSKWNYPIKH
jgi:hypothetical protein